MRIWFPGNNAKRIVATLSAAVRRAIFAAVLAAIFGFLFTGYSYAETIYELFFIGFSPTTPPADSLELRQAIAYSVDREAVAKAAAPHLKQAPHPAVTIQHPGLPEYNPGVRGYTYDPLKAKELYAKSGWTAPITIFVGPGVGRSFEAIHESILESVRKTLGGLVLTGRVANFEALVRMAQSGQAAVYMYGWISDRRDFGYPSFALGLAHERPEAEVKSLAEKHDINAVEQLMLDKALIVPIIYW